MSGKKYDTVIIGGGPAGYTAALYCARAGLDTLLIEMLSAGGQMAETGTVENYPGFNDGIDGFQLGENMQKSAEKFGAKTEYDQVMNIEIGGNPKKVVTANGSFLAYTVIIAAGAKQRKLNIEKENEFLGKGVHYCAHCDGMRYKGKTAAVIGGGDSAAEEALYLSKLCKKVYLIHRRSELRAVNSYLEKIEETENIELVLNSVPDRLLYDDKIYGISVKSSVDGSLSEISCDAVFVSIGRIPNTEFVKDKLLLDKNGYIIADESGKTNIEGVFAAGDIRTKELRQIITAASDGANASVSALKYIEKLKKDH